MSAAAVASPRRLAVIDVDATLIGEDNTVAARNLATFRRCASDDVYVAIATGHPFASAARYAMQAKARYLICLNGAAIFRHDARAVWLADGFDLDALTALLAIAQDFGVSLSLDTADTRYAATEIDARMTRMANRHRVALVPKDVASIAEPVLKGQFLADPARLAEIRSVLPPGLTASAGEVTESAYLEITAHNTKGDALRRLIYHLSLLPEDAVVVADGENDESLAASARHVVAVPGAHAALLRVATHVVCVAPEDGAVGVALDALLFDDEQANAHMRALARL